MRRILAVLALALLAVAVLDRLRNRSVVREGPGAQPVGAGMTRPSDFTGDSVDRLVLPAVPPDSEDPIYRSPIRGIVVDEHGAAVDGASVSAVARLAPELESLEPRLRTEAMPVFKTQTDSDGRFQVPAGDLAALDLIAHKDGYVDATAELCPPGSQQVLRLTQGVILAGTVRMEDSGAPVPRAKLRGQARGSRVPLFEVTSDASGAFQSPPLGPEQVFIHCFTDQGTPRTAFASTHGVRGIAHVDVWIRTGVNVVGRVLDATTGFPIAGARVSPDWTFDQSVLTDGGGRYSLPGFVLGAYLEIHVQADGYGRSEVVPMPMDGDDALLANFDLQPDHTVVGVLMDANRVPVSGARVIAIAAGQRMDWRDGVSDREGNFRLSGLRADVRHSLVVCTPWQSQVVYAFPVSEKEQRVTDFGAILLERGVKMRGVIQDASGLPIAGQRVLLLGTNVDRWSFSDKRIVNDLRDGWMLDAQVARRPAISDVAGRFQFGGVAPGEYRVGVEGPAGETLVERTVFVPKGGDDLALTLVIPDSVRIEGWVVDEAGNPVGAARVTVQGADGKFLSGSHTDSAGVFSFWPFGSRRVSIVVQPPAAGSSLRRLSAAHADVLLDGKRLELVLPSADLLRGRLVSDAKHSHQVVHVTVFDGQGNPLDSQKISIPGSFELVVPRSREVSLQVLPDYRRIPSAIKSGNLTFDHPGFGPILEVRNVRALPQEQTFVCP